MNLSSDLISALVKVTNTNTNRNTKDETTVYGTIVEYDGSNYVQLDGSELLTPIATTADIKAGERVTVMIKNHTAIVTGNITSPSARAGDVLEIGAGVDEIILKVNDINEVANQASADADKATTAVEEATKAAEEANANADKANAAAEEAAKAAGDANTNADNANTAAGEAAKTATNFMSLTSDEGLQIGNKSEGSWRGFRTQITDAAFNILDTAGTVLASYGAKLIELGKNAVDAVISLCGGKGKIEYVSDDGVDYLQITADKLRMKGDEMSSVYSMYTDDTSKWEKSAVNVTPTRAHLYASECIDPSLHDMLEGWNTSEIAVNPDSIDITSPGDVVINAALVRDAYGSFVSVVEGSSGIWSYRQWSNGNLEMWGTYEITDLACIAELGSMYRTDVFSPDAFPFAVYDANLVASYESDGYGGILWATTTTTTEKPPSYYLVRPTSATIASGKVNFHVTGKWTT